MTRAPQFSDLAVTCTDGVQQLRALLALLGLAFRRRWGSRRETQGKVSGSPSHTLAGSGLCSVFAAEVHLEKQT